MSRTGDPSSNFADEEVYAASGHFGKKENSAAKDGAGQETDMTEYFTLAQTGAVPKKALSSQLGQSTTQTEQSSKLPQHEPS